MSDNSSFSVVVTEGIHDVAVISKILRIKDFQEAQTIGEIPDFLVKLIPTSYPFEGTRLSRRVPFPSFFFRGKAWILVYCANSDSALANDLKGLLKTTPRKDVVSRLCCAAVLADADTRTAQQRRDGLYKKLDEALADTDDFQFDRSLPTQITLYGTVKPFAMYILPDNKHSGRLEQVLLQGAQEEYPELYAYACNYIESAKGLSWVANSGEFAEKKAVVGAITSVLRSGRAFQASIHDDNWFTEASLSNLSLHKALSDFIDMIIGWTENPPSTDQQDVREMAYSS